MSQRQFFKRASLLAGAALTFGLVSCDDDSVTVSPPPQAAAATNWAEVFERRTCLAGVDTGTCLGQSGFHVDAQGIASLGPENGPVEDVGTLTFEERERVVEAANRVAGQDLSTELLRCEVWIAGPGESGVLLRLRDPSSRVYTIFQKSLATAQLCYRGERARAEALYEAVNPLVDVYPSPTPTPTPTATPSPESTPTP